MASVSPTRPSRRAAAARKIIVDENSDVEVANISPVKKRSKPVAPDDGYAPVVKSPSKRAPRSSAVSGAGVAPPRVSALGRRRTRQSEATQLVDASSSRLSIVPSEPMSPIKSPTKKTASPRKRTSQMPSTTRPTPVARPILPPPMMPTPETTPEPTVKEEPEIDLEPRALADITTQSVNTLPAPSSPALKPKTLPIREGIPPGPAEIATLSNTSIALPVVAPTGNEPRLVIAYLTLTNFKSYAGVQRVGPFHASFSSVVGPNGSGKSNVIDSLLFVFGFRASKMRQGKLSALIHNSARFQDLSYCEVEVQFEEVKDLPGGAHEVMPDSQLRVSRRAFKNNSSDYYINDRKSTFTEVTTMLKGRGIDLEHKRFLILQGEVESIAQMKPKAANEHDDGLLEYLEDIIGTSKYKQPIEESAKEVDGLNEVCVEKQSRVQHVEKERNSLEAKKDKVLELIRDENELAMKQSTLYQIYLAECANNIHVTEGVVGTGQEELAVEMAKHKDSEGGLRELQKQLKALQKEHEIVEQEAKAMLKEMSKFEKDTVKHEEKKKFLSGKQKKLDKSIHAHELSASESRSLVQQYTDDVERLTKEVAELEKRRGQEEAELEIVRENLKGKTQSFSDQIEVKQNSLEPWNQKINAKQSAIAVARSELAILQEKGNAGEKATIEIEGRIQSLKTSLAEKEADILRLQEEKTAGVAKSRALEKELHSLQQKEPEVRNTLSHARQRAEEAKSSLAQSQSHGNVLSGLMRLRDSGRLDGFHGKLGHLGTIDSKYDVAISTACPSLENMVVDSVDVGQQCIEYLRKNNLGRANFICLDRLPKRSLAPTQTPEGVPRLFDLVKSKHDRFLPAFYSVMQDTLVAKDMTQANRIAYGAQRWRVVTLEGQLIDKSGTMSGGGTRVAKGAMSSKLVADTSKEQVAKLEVDREAQEGAFEQLQTRLREVEVELAEVSELLPVMTTKIAKVDMEISSLKQNMLDAEQRLKTIELEYQPSKQDESRVRTLEKQIHKLEAEASDLKAETSNLEAEIKTLQDEIMEVGGIKLRTQKAKVDGLKDQLDSLGTEISGAELNISRSHKQQAKHEKAVAQEAQDLQTIATDLEEVLAQIEAQAGALASAKEQKTSAQNLLDQKAEDLAALIGQLDAQQALLNESRAVEIEMKNRLEENQKVLADNQQRLRYWREKHGKLVLHNIHDLEHGVPEPEPEPKPEATPEPGDPDATDIDVDEDGSSLTAHSLPPPSTARTSPLEPSAPALPTHTPDELSSLSKDLLKSQIAALEEGTQSAQIDHGILSDYRRRVTEHAERTCSLTLALSARDSAKARVTELRRRRLDEFMAGLHAIGAKLKEMYHMITMGGNAELELVDSLDPFSEGVLFSVMPPKKSWKNIGNLSGGEKTLSSLALVFALHHYRPTPLYVMDEIDAALDFRNVSIVAGYIQERTRGAQFIVISLRNNMFELARRLVGVYKVNHTTKSIALENRDYVRQQ